MTILRRLLALSLAVPMAVTGCAAATEEGEGESGSAISTRTVSEGTKLRVTASKLNVRERGSTSARVVTVLAKGDLVTCITTSGQDGWVEIETADGETGWAFSEYLAEERGGAPSVTPPTSGPVSGDTCSPTRAQNAVSRFQKALHDTLAFAEGTQGFAKDGYNVIFSFQLMGSCASHPKRCIAFGSSCSDAAGRYQFLSTTWKGVANARHLTAFEPEDQERGAEYLISSVRRVTVPQDRPLTAAEFTNAISKLSYEWASLPPGRYGQPNKSMAALRTHYCSAVGC